MINFLTRLKAIRRHRMLLALPVAAAAAVVVLAACGTSGNSSGGSSGGAYGSAASSPAAGAPAAGAAALMLRHTSLGTILTNGRGFTLYAFEADKGTKSACAGACAAAWPPATTSAAHVTVIGATESLVGETMRADGQRQLTYAGHPLYLFSGDTTPGSTNGQGSEEFGAQWDVLTATGTEVTGG
jgi:predicted lipoprotein with Yx(FWY)xxD motif